MNYNEKAEEIFNSLTNRKKFVDKMPSNISQGESGVLLYLLNNDSVSQSELSEKLNITMPRVAAIINTLQDKMLVIKKTDPNDKRKTIITITEKGKKDILQKRKNAIIFIESIIKERPDLVSKFGSPVISGGRMISSDGNNYYTISSGLLGGGTSNDYYDAIYKKAYYIMCMKYFDSNYNESSDYFYSLINKSLKDRNLIVRNNEYKEVFNTGKFAIKFKFLEYFKF